MNLLFSNGPLILIPAAPLNIQKSPKSRDLIEEKIASILADSYYFPCSKEINGAFFIDNLMFAANLKILSQKLGIHTNSINKDFRHHKIKCIQKFPISKITSLYDAKGWKIYQHSNKIFSLQNILKGNIQITSRWDKNAKKHPIKESFKDEIKEIQKKEENEKGKSICSKTVKTIRYMSKISECEDDFFSEEEDEMYYEYLD